MYKGITNFNPAGKLYIRKRHTKKQYKTKTYHYHYNELIQTYRDPQDKNKVISKFIGFLGKKDHRKAHLEKIKRRMTGNYTLTELSKAIEKAVE